MIFTKTKKDYLIKNYNKNCIDKRKLKMKLVIINIV